jgi:hypothetical protein
VVSGGLVVSLVRVVVCGGVWWIFLARSGSFCFFSFRVRVGVCPYNINEEELRRETVLITSFLI